MRTKDPFSESGVSCDNGTGLNNSTYPRIWGCGETFRLEKRSLTT